jgi:hypothetical protein
VPNVAAGATILTIGVQHQSSDVYGTDVTKTMFSIVLHAVSAVHVHVSYIHLSIHAAGGCGLAEIERSYVQSH